MPRRFLPILLVLLLLLTGAGVMAYQIWTSIGGGEGMSRNGIIALVLGTIGTLALGGGLMSLVFISARRGYDDEADKANRDWDRR